MASLPLPAFSSYAAAKHALRGFLNTLQIGEREQGTGVRVAMVSPGPVDTPVYERATGATGRRPAMPPDSYHPETVASALVEVALAPRHERIVGGASKLVHLLYRHARPVAELVLLFVDRCSGLGRSLPRRLERCGSRRSRRAYRAVARPAPVET